MDTRRRGQGRETGTEGESERMSRTRTEKPQRDRSEMILGRTYLVPCVRSVWHTFSSRPMWLPVNGPLHDDADIIKVDFFHWHLDWRFLSRRQIRTIRERGYGIWGLPNESEVFTGIISEVYPDLGEEWLRNNRQGPEDGFVALENLPTPEIPVETHLQLKPRKLNAEYPPYPREFMMRHWLPDLEEAYRDHRLKEGLVCPHRGGDLSGSPVIGGTVTCPLHGLRWDLETGRLAPRGEDVRQQGQPGEEHHETGTGPAKAGRRTNFPVLFPATGKDTGTPETRQEGQNPGARTWRALSLDVKNTEFKPWEERSTTKDAWPIVELRHIDYIAEHCRKLAPTPPESSSATCVPRELQAFYRRHIPENGDTASHKAIAAEYALTVCQPSAER